MDQRSEEASLHRAGALGLSPAPCKLTDGQKRGKQLTLAVRSRAFPFSFLSALTLSRPLLCPKFRNIKIVHIKSKILHYRDLTQIIFICIIRREVRLMIYILIVLAHEWRFAKKNRALSLPYQISDSFPLRDWDSLVPFSHHIVDRTAFAGL